MSFWSTNKIEAEQAKTPLVTPFNPDRVKQGAYELSMGSQAAISREGQNRIIKLKKREVLEIPPGQFALLLTEEKVSIPNDVVSFISLKTSVKSQGLVNVSGFHVDPGFKCRLKFWVYNAGNQSIPILQGDPVFLIWFSDLDEPTRDPYAKNSPAHDEITSDDLRQLHGHLASPAALAEQIKRMEHKIGVFQWIGSTVIVILIGLCIALVTPLLDYIIKPVIQRFSISYPTKDFTAPSTLSGTEALLTPSPASPSPSPAADSRTIGAPSQQSSDAVSPPPITPMHP